MTYSLRFITLIFVDIRRHKNADYFQVLLKTCSTTKIFSQFWTSADNVGVSLRESLWQVRFCDLQVGREPFF
jgi:hypothetical protein